MIRTLLMTLAVLLPISASAQSLDARLKALSPGQWLSYDVPLQPGVRTPCCFDWDGHRSATPGVCRLGERDWNFGSSDRDPLAEPGDRLRLLLRRDADGFDRLRVLGAECPIDAAGATIVEAGDVSTDASLAFLEPSLAGQRKQRGQALVAIAHHAGSSADRLLASVSESNKSKDLRRDAVFWLANTRGEFGLQKVRAFVDSERDDDLQRHSVFAMSISPVPAAKTQLRDVARKHPDENVRGEAIFWLAQDDDEQAEAIIREALAGDASQEVRKKAVFALSQLPADRAVPALRALIEGNDSKDVRKEALFWLAQVDDDAVLPVFDELLGETK